MLLAFPSRPLFCRTARGMVVGSCGERVSRPALSSKAATVSAAGLGLSGSPALVLGFATGQSFPPGGVGDHPRCQGAEGTPMCRLHPA